MRRPFLIIFFCCSFSGILFSQTDIKQTDLMFAVRGGAHASHTSFYELGGFLFFTHGQTADGPTGWFGTFFSLERSFQKSELNHGKQIHGWTAGAEYDRAFPWGFRCSISGFQLDDKHSLKLCPEAGLSIYSMHLFVGYNFPLTNRNLIRNNGPTLSCYFGIPVFWHTFTVREK
ncbi:hypothetical protein BH09BAC5_BH09BAC5_20680 [soil metagenome]